MGWFWNKSPSSSAPSTDPLRDLDPSLRDFLSKESPIKYKPAPAPPPPPPPEAASPPPAQSEAPSPPLVPPESLYPDGRYAHLWSSYRPLAAIEAESKSDQEKLADVLQGYKARKAQIGRAAVENCVFEQLKIDDCYQNGSYMDRMRMCREESRGFERCYTMQSRFLKALGYLSSYDRPPEIDEQIQMHADTLYHRMLSQEKAIQEAKAAGHPTPEFPAILSPNHPPTTNTTTTPSPNAPATDPSLPPLSALTQSLLNPPSQTKLRERLKKLTPMERELEERSVQMEARNAEDMARRMREVEEGRKKRREEGKGTAADTVAGWFGW